MVSLSKKNLAIASAVIALETSLFAAAANATVSSTFKYVAVPVITNPAQVPGATLQYDLLLQETINGTSSLLAPANENGLFGAAVKVSPAGSSPSATINSISGNTTDFNGPTFAGQLGGAGNFGVALSLPLTDTSGPGVLERNVGGGSVADSATPANDVFLGIVSIKVGTSPTTFNVGEYNTSGQNTVTFNNGDDLDLGPGIGFTPIHTTVTSFVVVPSPPPLACSAWPAAPACSAGDDRRERKRLRGPLIPLSFDISPKTTTDHLLQIERLVSSTVSLSKKNLAIASAICALKASLFAASANANVSSTFKYIAVPVPGNPAPAPGVTLQYDLLLQETINGTSSLLAPANENGLFNVGVKVAPSGSSPSATINGISANTIAVPAAGNTVTFVNGYDLDLGPASGFTPVGNAATSFVVAAPEPATLGLLALGGMWRNASPAANGVNRNGGVGLAFVPSCFRGETLARDGPLKGWLH